MRGRTILRTGAVALLLAGLAGLAVAQDQSLTPPPEVFSTPFGTGLPTKALPHDLSPMGMYRAADPVVKGVLLVLVAASVVTWTVLLVKLAELIAAGRGLSRGVARLTGPTLPEAPMPGLPGALLAAARDEMAAGVGLPAAGIKDRISLRLSRLVASAARRMGRGTGILATIGAVAPFVGLFGTVWGIMNAFIGISKAQTTNLAVVAPGIAEALLATALGLVAAIPAVVIYNLLTRLTAGHRARLIDAAALVERLAGRDIDRRG